MTLQQQAHGLIDRLSDESLQNVILLMRRMLPRESAEVETVVKSPDSISPKMKAYQRMQELRRL